MRSRFFGSTFWQAYYVELTILGVTICIITLRALEYAEPFSCISGIRELSDGRVIVSFMLLNRAEIGLRRLPMLKTTLQTAD